MSAAEAQVAAAQEALGCKREFDELTLTIYCAEHNVGWLRDVNACVRAESVADAVVAAGPDPATTAAEALREAANEYDSSKESDRAHWRDLDALYTPGGPSMPVFWLRARADRIEESR